MVPVMSVIIPLYNKSSVIGDTLRSVLGQTFQDFEIIIVNDGSTDNSVEVVKEFADKRIRIVEQQNQGVSAARNKGIEYAQADYIAFLDADDLWDKEYLMSQYEQIRNFPDCSVYGAKYRMQIGSEAPKDIKINSLPFNNECGIMDNYFHVAALSHPPLWTSSLVVKKEAIQSVGNFPVGIKSGEDLLTWARLACMYKIAYRNRAMATYFIDGYRITDKPRRTPSKEDPVGMELIRLKNDFDPPYIKEYLSFWFKMRSSLFMRSNMKRESIRNALKGISFNPLNYKLYIYLGLNIIPGWIKK